MKSTRGAFFPKAISRLLILFLLILLPVFLNGQVAMKRSTLVSELEFRAELNRLVPEAATIEEGSCRFRLLSGLYITPLEFSVHKAPSAAAAVLANRVASVTTSDRSTRTKIASNCEIGTYVLTVNGHPQLKALITVTPRSAK